MDRILSISFGLVALVLLTGCKGKDQYADIYKDLLNKPLSAIELQTLEGHPVPVADFASGELPAVVNIWATWCTPCLKELPSLYTLFTDEHASVLTIAVDKNAEDVQAYLAKNNLQDLPVLWDPLGKQTRAKWAASQLPVTYILDAEGTLRAVEVGERMWDHPKMLAKINAATKP